MKYLVVLYRRSRDFFKCDGGLVITGPQRKAIKGSVAWVAFVSSLVIVAACQSGTCYVDVDDVGVAE